MNIEDLEEELENIFPNGFSIETDSKGQIVIHTGLREDEDGELVSFTEDSDEEDEEDPEADPDFEPLEDDDEDE